MKKFTVLYGTGRTEVINAKTLLEAQKKAHKAAEDLSTIVISVKENL